ncbi:hypothetical protein LTR95_002768 [Oleoguttula sp. CCFEE 5521]
MSPAGAATRIAIRVVAIYEFLPEGDKTTTFRHGVWVVDIHTNLITENFPADALALFNTSTKTRAELTPHHDRWVQVCAPFFVLGRSAQVHDIADPAVFFHLAKHASQLQIRIDIWYSNFWIAQKLHELLRDLGPGHSVEFIDFRMEGWSVLHDSTVREAIDASFDCLESMECKTRHEIPWRGIWSSVQSGFYVKYKVWETYQYYSQGW